MLVHAHEGVTGSAVEDRRERCADISGGPVPPRPRRERYRSGQFRECREPRHRQRAHRIVQRASGSVGGTKRRIRVHVAIDLADPERGLVGVQRRQLTGGESGGRVSNDDAVEVPGSAAGQGRQRDGFRGRGAGRIYLRIGDTFVGQRRPPRCGGDVGGAISDEQDPQVERVGRRRSGRGVGGGRQPSTCHG